MAATAPNRLETELTVSTPTALSWACTTSRRASEGSIRSALMLHRAKDSSDASAVRTKRACSTPRLTTCHTMAGDGCRASEAAPTGEKSRPTATPTYLMFFIGPVDHSVRVLDAVRQTPPRQSPARPNQMQHSRLDAPPRQGRWSLSDGRGAHRRRLD